MIFNIVTQRVVLLLSFCLFGLSGCSSGSDTRGDIGSQGTNLSQDEDANSLTAVTLAAAEQTACNLLRDHAIASIWDYNVFVRHTMTGAVHVGGAVAAGGTLEAHNFSINHASSNPVAISIGGTWVLEHGTVYGDTFYNGGSLDETVDFQGTVHPNPSLILFGDVFVDLERIADALCDVNPDSDLGQLAASATVGFSDGGDGRHVVMFTGGELLGNPFNVNIFKVQDSDINLASQVVFNVDENATNIVCIDNIAGALTFSNFQTSGVDPEDLIWVTPSSGGIDIKAFQFIGSLMAPEANINAYNGEMRGQLFARGSTGTTWLTDRYNKAPLEFHNNAFDICPGVGPDGNCTESQKDCEGVCFGTSHYDGVGVCCDITEIDCKGVCGGTAVVDCNGNCGGTAVVDCAGVCGGPAGQPFADAICVKNYKDCNAAAPKNGFTSFEIFLSNLQAYHDLEDAEIVIVLDTLLGTGFCQTFKIDACCPAVP